MKLFGFAVAVFPEGTSYSAWCPELDVASQGGSVEEALSNLKEAMELHLECLSPSEILALPKKHGALVTTIELPVPA